MEHHVGGKTQYIQLPHQQTGEILALLGYEPDKREEQKAQAPGLEQPPGLESETAATAVNGHVVINNGQDTQQQKHHQQVFGCEHADVVADQQKGDTDNRKPVESCLNRTRKGR